MISQIKQQGFTIVELLIVIVVIAILAALSYVGYTSITARANNSTAMASAKAVKDTMQVFNGSHGSWPANRAAMVSGYPSGGDATAAVAKLPSDVLFHTTTAHSGVTAAIQGLTGNNAAKTVLVYPCVTAGYRIYYKDFTGSTPKSIDVGDCSTVPLPATNSMG